MVDNNMAQCILLYLHMKNISSYVMNDDDRSDSNDHDDDNNDDDDDDYQKYI